MMQFGDVDAIDDDDDAWSALETNWGAGAVGRTAKSI